MKTTAWLQKTSKKEFTWTDWIPAAARRTDFFPAADQKVQSVGWFLPMKQNEPATCALSKGLLISPPPKNSPY